MEKDSEYCQKFLEEEEEVTVNVTNKGGGISKYRVRHFYPQMIQVVNETKVAILLKVCLGVFFFRNTVFQ